MAHALSGYKMLFQTADRALVALEDSVFRDAIVTARDRWALVFERQRGEHADALLSESPADVHVVDLGTGDRRMALIGVKGIEEVSPDGQRFVFYSDGQFYLYEIASGQSRSITSALPTSFDKASADANTEAGPRLLAWASDSRSVLISDGWDLWNIPVTGIRAANLTVDGKANGIRYEQLLFHNGESAGVDLRKPLYLKARGEWTGAEGVARINAQRPGAVLWLWTDASIDIHKAAEADVFFYSRQTATDFPDYHVVNGFDSAGVRVTRANPQQAEFLWTAGARLIDYTSESGARMQAILQLPANYTAGTRYPTIVALAEEGGKSLHMYALGRADDPFNPALYTSRGYAVLFPRVQHTPNNPGASALHAVKSALAAAAAGGITDTARVGMYGRALGGYHASYVISHTAEGIFAAAAASAPVTSLVNMGGSAVVADGNRNAALRRTVRQLFAGSFADSSAPYVRNSPLYSAASVYTPLLLLHNENDDLVDVRQSLDFYSALRQLRKPVVLLQYPDEGHSLLSEENQADAASRLFQFFDHYLRGGAAPAWITGGAPNPLLPELYKH
jgi:acetyl esterase/lipase